MRDARGFTLLEVMIAVAVMAVAFPILLGLRNTDLAMWGKARELTTATLLAQEKLFETELMGLPPIGEQAGGFADRPPGFPLSAEVTDRAPGYKWKRTVVTTPFDTVREVRIQVSWPRGTGEESVEVTSYVIQEQIPQR
jgi:general secretion pathway protein I